MTESKIRTNGIYHKDYNLSGTTVTNADAGWYYAEVPLSLPSGAFPLSVVAYGSYDASVHYAISRSSGGKITIKSPTSRTLGSNRYATVYYYYE